MTTTFRTLARYALKTLTWVAFLAFVGLAAGMIMAYGETAQGLGDFLAPIIVAGLFLIALTWLSGKGQQALSRPSSRQGPEDVDARGDSSAPG
ncbi:hypothetical protein [Halomonas sp. M4R1S46]|uniref:hypothetical protein n=1 Tax=Halomonas sp. M4R1S46 TaxID=2982692 RepID=UPI0021E3BE3E|nr:hypothetical protein [Halomonas sp. M4R1S46]UYG09593.1 hypothetical protein OCT48_09750 [Halomonas sp. M4R1S46]